MDPPTACLATFALAGEDFLLRRATESDVEPIVALMSGDQLRDEVDWVDAECRARHLAAFEAIDAQHSELLCVVLDSLGAVVATMQLTFLQGLGSAMIQWAVAEAGRHGVSLLQLTSDNARVDARRFYQRLGFSQSPTGFKLQLP